MTNYEIALAIALVAGAGALFSFLLSPGRRLLARIGFGAGAVTSFLMARYMMQGSSRDGHLLLYVGLAALVWVALLTVQLWRPDLDGKEPQQ